MTIRFATQADTAGILEVYAPYILQTPVTFEYAVPEVPTFAARIASVTQRFPWLVCEQGGKIMGYVYAGRHRERAAFDWDVEVSAYFRPECQGQGLGRAMYRCLFDLLKPMGYLTAYALICVPNGQSIGFHRAMGFTQIGVYEKTGFKLGAWRDLAILEKQIAPLPGTPAPTNSLWNLPIAETSRQLKMCEEAIRL